MLTDPEKQAISDLCQAAANFDIPCMLVGAGARILVFDHYFQVQGRSTTDWDWGVKIESWEGFEALVAEMTQGTQPLFRQHSIIHRFEHIATGTMMDLVPFGPIAEPEQELAWPNDRTMNVLGYEEALMQAEEVRLGENLTAKVVNIPALVVLKLIAWQDRGGSRDLDDVDLILQNYFDDAIYERLRIPLISGIVDIEDAGPFDLGQCIQKQFGIDVVVEVDRVLECIISRAEQLIPSLIPRRAENWDELFERALQRYQALRQGLNTDSDGLRL